jgi:homoserine dehydrogenase
VTRVALLGFGTVGQAVARRLTDLPPPLHGQLTLTHIFDRRARQKRHRLPADLPITFTDRIDDVLRTGADVVVEAIGGIEPVHGWLREALLTGRSVVTANKQLVAHHGPSLWRIAARQGRQFRFEAAVGGAMPIVRAISESLCGDRLTRIVAILNGTTNAVLSQMESTGCTLATALAGARAAGLAEADASADLAGDDAAAKLAILCALAFGVRISPAAIPRRSSAAVTARELVDARAHGGTIRQIAFAEFDYARAELGVWVAPAFVADGTILARTVGAQNAAVITGTHGGEMAVSGTGAGGDATAVAVLSDLAAIARDRSAIVPAPSLTSEFTVLPSSPGVLPSSFSLSFCLLPSAFSLCSSEAV